MNPNRRKLLTIITEAVLEESLIREIVRLGAHGYTVTDARGKGDRGVRSASWEASSNIRIEVVCTAEMAEAIGALLKKNYYENYAMIVFVTEVDVMRPEKF
ncbi:transcriptional regulator [bacterium]|nr:transcriptional regulator [bacterium]